MRWEREEGRRARGVTDRVKYREKEKEGGRERGIYIRGWARQRGTEVF